MYFTEEGRAWRDAGEGNLDSLAREAEKLLGAVDQVRAGVAELQAARRRGSGAPRTRGSSHAELNGSARCLRSDARARIGAVYQRQR